MRWLGKLPILHLHSFLGYTATAQTMPLSLISAGQMFLARAEAAKLGWTSENATTMYNSGVTAEMNRWGISNAGAIATYLAQPSVALAWHLQQTMLKLVSSAG
jgi:hypothetical protein